jgi:hypothetical protein
VARRPPAQGSARAIAVVAVVLVALAAARSTLGMSFLDDGYYAAATLRLAQGARLFADEMYVQSLGFLAAVPFAKLWTSLFGLGGFVVVALRLFYVALADRHGARGLTGSCAPPSGADRHCSGPPFRSWRPPTTCSRSAATRWRSSAVLAERPESAGPTVLVLR